MRDFFRFILVVLFGSYIFWPWVVGIVDMNWVMMTGSQLSSVHWSSERGLCMFFWPLFNLAIIWMIISIGEY